MSRRPKLSYYLFLISICLFTYFLLFSAKTPEIEEEFRIGTLEPNPLNSSFSKYLKRLGFYDDYKSIDIRNGLSDFTLVTAFSENHAGEARHLAINVSRAFPGRKVVMYGIGLWENTEEWFMNACNVDYRRANFSGYPSHVRTLKNYAFKPLIVVEALQEFGAIMWVDTSTVWLGKTVSDFLKQLNSFEIDYTQPLMFMFTLADHNTFSTTHQDMYRFLPPVSEEWLKGPMYESGKILIYRTKETMEKALKWWVLCALQEKCIAPQTSRLKCDEDKRTNGTYAGCHRYDQSALNLILAPHPKSFLPLEFKKGFLKSWRITVSQYSTVCCTTGSNQNSLCDLTSQSIGFTSIVRLLSIVVFNRLF